METLLVTRRFPPAPGGVEAQALEVALRLARIGHKVRVCTSNLYRDFPLQMLPFQHRSESREIDVRRYTTIPIPWRKREGTTLSPTLLIDLAKRPAPKLAHCYGLNLFSVSASLYVQRLRKCKALCTTHVDPSLLSGRFVAETLSKFDGLVALTEIERKRMLSLGLNNSRIRVIPNGIDLAAFKNLPDREDFRKRMEIADRLVLYAGRIDTSKGCDILLEAVSLARDRIGECTVVFAGPDWGYKQSLQEQSRHTRVKAAFTGNLSPQELRSALVACDVFVLPSRSEAFGISILEAMLCGAPVVATRVGGIPEIVRDGNTGTLVPPGNPVALSEAIAVALEDSKRSHRLAANAKTFAARYSIDDTVDKLERFYLDVLSW